jgi:glycosyltransferase involved in cell wall biosynthesis
MIHKYKPQVIWSTFPIATAHLIGLTLHRLTGLPWIADFRDPMIQSEFPETKLQRKTYQWIENLTVLNCQTAIFTTQSTMQSYKVRYPKHLHNKFIIIENGYDEDDFSDVKPAKPAQPAKSTKCITLLHSGLLYMPGRNPSALFDAISSLKALSRIDATLLSIVLRSTGDINFYTALAAQYKVEDIVKILPPIPYKDALSEMLTVDGLLIFQGEQFNSQIPAKIYEYFRAKKPIFSLLDAKGETASMLKTAGFLNMVSIESSEAIVPALENFILQIGSNTAHLASDDLIEKSSRENRANELAGVLDQTRQINLSY